MLHLDLLQYLHNKLLILYLKKQNNYYRLKWLALFITSYTV